MHTSHTVACLLSFLFAAPVLGAQEPQPVMTDGSAFQIGMPSPVQQPPLKTGTGRIRGRIQSSDTGAPVRRARIQLTGPGDDFRNTLSDGDGRFEFRDLPTGRFALSADKSGYLFVRYGQQRPSGVGKPIDLSEAQLLDDVGIVMQRASAISGRILDEFGEPITDATVTAMHSAWMNGRRGLQPAGRMTTTNDLGQFRLFGLAAGDYYVGATVRDPIGMGVSMAVMTAAPASDTPASGATAPSAGYAPTYFPGTINTAEAQKITIAAGQDALNTDFALLPARLARITGFVINSAGKPVEGTIVEAVARSGEVVFSPEAGNSAPTARNGAFMLEGVPPGDYLLRSQPLLIATTGSGDTMTLTARFGGGEAETGSLAVSVAGENLSNVVIATSKAATASGQVSFDGGAKLTSLTGLQISAHPTGISAPGMEFPNSSGMIGPDGSFALRGLSGTRLIRVEGLPKGWMLKSVRANGVDVTDTGIDFKPGETLTSIDVVLTSKVAGISGSVTGPTGAPVRDYTLVVFSDDPQRWTLPNSRYVLRAQPDQDGRFAITNLPEGGYYAAATDEILEEEWSDPDLLDRLKATATKFTLSEGATRALDLKLSDRP
jgi:hypothetical protein